MENYKILNLCDNVYVQLIGTNNKYQMLEPWFKMDRKSIAEGIFESQLAEAASCSMSDGNTYKLHMKGNNIMYIHIDGEYAYFGADVISTRQTKCETN